MFIFYKIDFLSFSVVFFPKFLSISFQYPIGHALISLENTFACIGHPHFPHTNAQLFFLKISFQMSYLAFQIQDIYFYTLLCI